MTYSKQDLENAISEYRAGCSRMSIRAVAKSYKIPFSTLRDRINGHHVLSPSKRQQEIFDPEKFPQNRSDGDRILAHSKAIVPLNERVAFLERAYVRALKKLDQLASQLASQVAQKNTQIEAQAAQIAVLVSRKRRKIRMERNPRFAKIDQQLKKTRDRPTATTSRPSQKSKDVAVLQEGETAKKWAASYNPKPLEASMDSCLRNFYI